MKFFAVILSIYILALTAMPCNDNHSVDANSIKVELSEYGSNHANDMDLCSPFCFCDCCQTLSFPSFFNMITINVVKITFNFNYKVSSFSSPVISIWQPPQI